MTTDPKVTKPTLARVAERARVSAPTVSKVINGRDDVAPATRARVLAALEEAGYQSPRQRRVATPGPRAVEVMLDALDSAYMVELLSGILGFAARVDVEVVVSVTGGLGTQRPTPERRAQRMIDEGRTGLIAVTSALDESELSAFLRRRLHVVVVDPDNPPDDVVSVGGANWSGGKSATEHLLELGHTRIAFLGGTTTAECNQARLHGYLAALMARGVPVHEEYMLSGHFRTEQGVRGLATLLALDTPPTAVFAASDAIAFGVLQEARRRSISVPEGLSVVGFDGTFQAESSVPRLTSVTQHLEAMGGAALRSVLRQMNGEVLDSRRVELATQLVVRDSTAPPGSF